MQTQLQRGRYIHVCINETHSSKSTRFNPYFGWIVLLMIISAKVGIKSCRFARECVSFMHTWMYLPRWSCVYMISEIASLLLVSLLFISIPTPFLNLNFYLFLVNIGISRISKAFPIYVLIFPLIGSWC